MKYSIALLGLLYINIGCSYPGLEKSNVHYVSDSARVELDQQEQELKIHPINHATFVMEWNGITIYNDPTGGATAFEEYTDPDIILISDIHGDHLNQKTLDSLNTKNTTFIMPKAVAEKLSVDYGENAFILDNGEEVQVLGIKIKAIPMYNLPETVDSRHPKGRGNGYVLELDNKKIYISGDTEDIKEMRSLEGIDIAFVAMNLPYTMSVEQASEGVIAFEPKVVYPYHYRGQGGLSDVEKFRELVNASGKKIEVRLLDWYKNDSR
ncbi:MAG: MBL fold metallo-hydrolase [Candidatus Cyclobacteriaceae bacterium M2_1C_046]